MAIALDEITRRKLILVRQLYERARLTSVSQHSYVDRIMALIGFDLANETLIKIVISTLSAKHGQPGFREIINQANSLLNGAGLPSLTDAHKIQRVRNLRNDAQHDAKYPNESDLSDSRTYTRDFLSQTAKDVWGVDLDTVRLVDMIQTEVIRNRLIEADKQVGQGEFTKAIQLSITSFNFASRRASSRLSGPPIPSSAFEAESISDQATNAEIHRLRTQLAYTIVGLDFRAYGKFKKAIRGIYVNTLGGEKTQTTIVGRSLPTEEEARFAVDFVTDTVIQIESFLGDSL
jgi:hypothetical protein